jgi:hypothetical protein
LIIGAWLQQYRKENAMLWIFMLIVGAAATFTTLGMFVVWFKVLSIALTVAVVTVLMFVVSLVMRRFLQK